MFNSADKPTCGLSISDRSIEILKLDEKRNVETFARASLEPGVVVNGEVLKKKKLKRILKKLFQEADLSAPKLVLGLPESKVFVDYFELSKKLEGKKLREKIQEHAKETVPLEQNRIYWDFIKKEIEGEIRIVYIAVLKEAVHSFLGVLEQLELSLEIVDIEALALRRALLSPAQKGPVAIADIGSRTSNLSFFNEHKLLSLTVSEAVAGSTLDEAIKEKLGVNLKQAKELKEKQGLKGDGEQGKKIKGILEDELDRLVLGIKQAFEHYQEDLNLEVDTLILAGGCSLIPGLREYLGEQLEPDVRLGDSLKNIKAGEPFKKKEKPLLFATVIGLALTDFDKDEHEINFLKAQKEQSRVVGSEQKPDSDSILKKLRNSTLLAVVLFSVGMLILGYVLYARVYKARSPSSSDEVTPQTQSATSSEVEDTQNEATSSQVTSSTQEDSIIDTEPSSTSSAQADIGEIEIDSPEYGWLNVRQGPDPEHGRLTTVDDGEVFRVLEEKNDWYKIELAEGQVGWVSAKYTKQIKD